jgi:hypothetical protein
MKRFLLVATLIFFALDATAAVRRLATDCTLPGYTPSEAQPFDLDSCTIQNGDDITQLLTDIRSKWPSGFYVRAPSRSISVISNTINWPSDTKFYVFMEDQDANNKMLIQHANPPTDFYTLWKFQNFDTVKIGGKNLSLTLKGNHPGLANCDVQYPTYTSSAICDANRGLLEFRMTDGTMANLADVRANISYAQQYSIYTWGDAGAGGTKNKIYQLNVAGLHYATSGVFFHQGVRNAWADPNKTVISDPYMRMAGWDGSVPGASQGGLPMGCGDQNKDQVRMASFNGYYTDSVTGGITIEYGGGNFVQRYGGRFGTSAADPFVVRVKDWMVTGPNEQGYRPGVRVKKTSEVILFKGDPHDTPDTGQPIRFVRFVKVPSTYGDGPANSPLAGCAYNNNTFDGASNLIRLENSTDKLNRDWYVTLSGDWNTNFVRGELFLFAFDPSRSYRHTLNADSGTTITDLITMYDTDTVTGPGTYTNIRVSDYSASTQGQANTITATNVTGSVLIDANTATTTISNVDFKGSARTIITVGSGSSAVVSHLCAAAGSNITGAGKLTYDGVDVTMPFTVSGANNCSDGSPPVPMPPSDVIVD